MKKIFVTILVGIAVFATLGSASIGFISPSHTTASLNCKTISGWVSFLGPAGDVIGIVTESSCRATGAIADLIIGPEPTITEEIVPEAKVFAPNLPDVPGAPDPTEGIPQLIAFIYGFALWIVGVLVFLQITRAGVMWLLAAGNASKIGSAKSLITNAIVGLIILLSSVVILNTINPTLTQNAFTLPEFSGGTPGISEEDLPP